MKKLILLLLAFIIGNNSFSQKDIDSDNLKFSSFAAGIDYTTDNSLNGTTSIYSTQPVSSLFVSYYHKTGINLSLYFSNIENSDESNTQATQEYALSLGYDLDINNWLSTSANYSHYEFSENSHALRSNYSDLFNVNAFSQVNWWNSNLDIGIYLGQAQDLYCSFQTGADINFDNVLIKNNSLSIQPSFVIYASSIDYYNEDAFKNYYFLYEYSQNNPDQTISELLSIIEDPQSTQDRIISRIVGRRPYYYRKIKQLDADIVISDLFKKQSAFNISSMGFSLPVYYQWGNFMLNVGYSLYKPMNQPSYVEEDWTGFTNVGVTYFLIW